MNDVAIQAFQVVCTFHETRGQYQERIERADRKSLLSAVRYVVDDHNIHGRTFRIYAIVGGRRTEITEDQLNALS